MPVFALEEFQRWIDDFSVYYEPETLSTTSESSEELLEFDNQSLHSEEISFVRENFDWAEDVQTELDCKKLISKAPFSILDVEKNMEVSRSPSSEWILW